MGTGCIPSRSPAFGSATAHRRYPLGRPNYRRRSGRLRSGWQHGVKCIPGAQAWSAVYPFAVPQVRRPHSVSPHFTCVQTLVWSNPWSGQRPPIEPMVYDLSMERMTLRRWEFVALLVNICCIDRKSIAVNGVEQTMAAPVKGILKLLFLWQTFVVCAGYLSVTGCSREPALSWLRERQESANNYLAVCRYIFTSFAIATNQLKICLCWVQVRHSRGPPFPERSDY